MGTLRKTKKQNKMKEITLQLPIKIRETVNNDGYIITDAKQVEFFFYEKELGAEEMKYDGYGQMVEESGTTIEYCENYIEEQCDCTNKCEFNK